MLLYFLELTSYVRPISLSGVIPTLSKTISERVGPKIPVTQTATNSLTSLVRLEDSHSGYVFDNFIRTLI
jgi:hypothetical protein